MPDLKQVKAEIKAWEKAFKADRGRDPVKADIKAEPEIAAKYAEYRKLTKEAPAGVKRDSTGRPKAGPSEPVAAPVFSTPKKPKPATSFETPKSQRSNNPFASPASLSRGGAVASASASNGSRRPVHDPSPVNPFASPSQPSYIYAESPKKFKALLEAGSAQKRANGIGHEITPRTRARKRLRGEPVEDTPGKPKSRTMSRINSVGASGRAPGPSRQVRASSRSSALSDMEDDEEDEVLGPTPVKPGLKGLAGQTADSGHSNTRERRFELVFDDAERRDPPSPLRGMRLFRRTSEEASGPKMGGTIEEAAMVQEPNGTRAVSTVTAEASSPDIQMGDVQADHATEDPSEVDQPMADVSGDPSPPAEGKNNETISPAQSPSSLPAGIPDPRMVPDELLAHDIEISSDEGGEDQAGPSKFPAKMHSRTKLRIASSRLVTQQRIIGKERTTQRFGPRASPPPTINGTLEGDIQVPIAPTLGLASLALSPTSKVVRRTLALLESRAKAVFDSQAAQKLRLAKQAPVWLPGESEQAEGSDGEVFAADDSTADDDWESDAEGWKATGLPDEEDW